MHIFCDAQGPLCHTVPKVNDFSRYNRKCSGENLILRGIFHVVSRFPLHFMLYRGYLDCFSNSVYDKEWKMSAKCDPTLLEKLTDDAIA